MILIPSLQQNMFTGHVIFINICSFELNPKGITLNWMFHPVF